LGAGFRVISIGHYLPMKLDPTPMVRRLSHRLEERQTRIGRFDMRNGRDWQQPHRWCVKIGSRRYEIDVSHGLPAARRQFRQMLTEPSGDCEVCSQGLMAEPQGCA